MGTYQDSLIKFFGPPRSWQSRCQFGQLSFGGQQWLRLIEPSWHSRILLGGVFFRFALEGGLGVVSEDNLLSLLDFLGLLAGNVAIQLCDHSLSEGVVGSDGLFLVQLIVSSGGGNVFSDGSEFHDDGGEGLWVKGGGELDEREQWVGVTDFLHPFDDLFDFRKLSGSSIVPLDVVEV